MVLAAAVTLAYLPARGFWFFLALTLLHAAALAPMTVLADALSLGAANRRPGFEYGWVRGTGSAAFIVGTLVSGQAVGAYGLEAIIWSQALLLGAAALAGMLVPELLHVRTADAVRAPAGGVIVLFRVPVFRNLVLAAALILGSHAMHDAFAAIYATLGIGAATALMTFMSGILYSMAGRAGLLGHGRPLRARLAVDLQTSSCDQRSRCWAVTLITFQAVKSCEAGCLMQWMSGTMCPRHDAHQPPESPQLPRHAGSHPGEIASRLGNR
jgi:hypothetical protein